MEKNDLQDLQKKIRSLSRLSVITLLLLIIFSASVFYTIASIRRAEDPTMQTLFLNKAAVADGDPGRMVRTVYLKSCFDAYDSLMKVHGFAEKPFTDSVHLLDTASIITRWESFGGFELYSFLQRAASLHTDNINVTIKVRIGVYTEDYLKRHHTDPDIIKRKKGRLAIFLITKKREDGKMVDEDDDYGFDLGEINPPKDGKR
jgi:hypothetical protein